MEDTLKDKYPRIVPRCLPGNCSIKNKSALDWCVLISEIYLLSNSINCLGNAGVLLVWLRMARTTLLLLSTQFS